MVKEYKNVRRAFKKNDTNGSGTLTINKFKSILSDCGIKVGMFNWSFTLKILIKKIQNKQVAGDDLYHILCEFDENMDGKISYEEFLNRLITI